MMANQLTGYIIYVIKNHWEILIYGLLECARTSGTWLFGYHSVVGAE